MNANGKHTPMITYIKTKIRLPATGAVKDERERFNPNKFNIKVITLNPNK